MDKQTVATLFMIPFGIATMAGVMRGLVGLHPSWRFLKFESYQSACVFALLAALAFQFGGVGWVLLSAVVFLCAVLLGFMVQNEDGAGVGFSAGLFLALIQLAIGIALMFVGVNALPLAGITPITMH